MLMFHFLTRLSPAGRISIARRPSKTHLIVNEPTTDLKPQPSSRGLSPAPRAHHLYWCCFLGFRFASPQALCFRALRALFTVLGHHLCNLRDLRKSVRNLR